MASSARTGTSHWFRRPKEELQRKETILARVGADDQFVCIRVR
jgi:hypothetical protein